MKQSLPQVLRKIALYPMCFVDISEFMDNKITIMNKYKSEVGETPFS